MLYAETHFRFFPFFPSLLFKKEPEVVFDLPYRCEPGKDLPVFLILNDVDRFPAEVKEVAISVSQKGLRPLAFAFQNPKTCLMRHPLEFQSNVFRFVIPRGGLPSGRIQVNCKAEMTNRRGQWTVLNDNFATTSKLPFSCFLSDEPLPGAHECSYGDLHVHSQYSQSHVEFGPPVAAIGEIADVCGLDFLSITDHSYDLCCGMTDYLKAGKDAPRWNSSVSEINRPDGFARIVIQGEEISAFNWKGRAVHLCAAGITDYIPGSADGARAARLPTLTLSEAIRRIHEQGGIALAAHPGSRPGIAQRLLLRRGNWSNRDLKNDIDAVQAVNNGFAASWQRAKKMWVAELLSGRRISLAAGNDSHGDFNRYRYISTPFANVAENFNRHLSFARTGIYKKVESEKEVLEAIKKGETFVTSGPFLQIVPSVSRQSAMTFDEKCNTITIKSSSSYEFGSLSGIQVFEGLVGGKAEKVVLAKSFNDGKTMSCEIPLPVRQKTPGYIRVEAVCAKDNGSPTFAATSPLYFGAKNRNS